MESSVYSLSEKDWGYLAEGNQHIILKNLLNPFENQECFFVGKVLKVEKIHVSKTEENVKKIKKLNSLLENYVKIHLYKENIQLSKYLLYEECLFINNQREFLINISKKIQSFRAEKRRIKEIDLDSDILISENLSILYPESKGFIIEIKPKCPFPEVIERKEFDAILMRKFYKFEKHSTLIYNSLKEKLRELRFFKMQIVRNEKELKIKDIYSKFDPRDLFSNDYARVKFAIESLLKTNTNNLIVHCNNIKLEPNIFIEAIVEILMNNQILFDNIINFQKRFEFNLEDMKKLFQKADISEIEKILVLEKNIFTNNKENPCEYTIKEILNFLISLTWKDLGIMINFVLDENNEMLNGSLLQAGYKSIKKPIKGFYRIGLIDVKLKSFEKILNYNDSQNKINEIYLSSLIENFIKNNDFN